jgi:mRNA interferase RelE/StbE
LSVKKNSTTADVVESGCGCESVQYRVETRGEERTAATPKEIILRVLSVVEGLRTNPFPVGVRKLVGAEDQYRMREGSYRVIYTVHADRLVVEVLRVGHRKGVYR